MHEKGQPSADNLPTGTETGKPVCTRIIPHASNGELAAVKSISIEGHHLLNGQGDLPCVHVQ